MRESPEGRGFAEEAFSRLFLRHGHVISNVAVGGDFHVIELGGAELQAVSWTPGEIVQVGMGGFKARSYTPFAWDPEAGRAKLLVYTRAAGPGSAWASAVVPGTACEFFGPREALRHGVGESRVLLFGDETSFALALALTSRSAIKCVFEADAPERSRPVLSALGLSDVNIFARTEMDAHLSALSRLFLTAAADADRVVLTGKASSIQRMRQALKQSNIVPHRLVAKAYWATGKTGLD